MTRAKRAVKRQTSSLSVSLPSRTNRYPCERAGGRSVVCDSGAGAEMGEQYRLIGSEARAVASLEPTV